MQDFDKWCHEAAGNWRHFDSFAWHGQPANKPEWWAHQPLDNRDSGPMGESNAAAIEDELRVHAPRSQWRIERHSHWGVGWVNVLVFKVWGRRVGDATKAARVVYELAAALEEYPVLDDEDYSRREWEAAQEAWEWAGKRERMEACVASGLSFLAARRKELPNECFDRYRVE